MPAMCHDESGRAISESQAFDAALAAACAGIGLSVDQRQRELMLTHFQRVVEANRRFNLTRITSPSDAAVKHYADSLTLLAAPWIDVSSPVSVLDVGTGAGFPAVPLAIMCPHWRILAIDGTGKKARFVADTAAAIGLNNLQARHARAEELDKGRGAPFDLILARAVGKIAEVLPKVSPLLSTAASVVFYKTDKIELTEVSQSIRAAAAIGLSMAEPFDVELPSRAGTLHRRLMRFERMVKPPNRL
jgi:16S rRNA (guanine527-N7)-methyltransferase